MPLTRYGEGSPLELTIGMSSEEDNGNYTVNLPSEIQQLTPLVTRVKFPDKWDKYQQYQYSYQ